LRRGNLYWLLLGVLAALPLSSAEAMRVFQHEQVFQAIPIQNYEGWRPGQGQGTGTGRQERCAQLLRERDQLRERMDQAEPWRRERLQQRVWETRDEFRRLCDRS
jgi:hypothetical protein